MARRPSSRPAAAAKSPGRSAAVGSSARMTRNRRPGQSSHLDLDSPDQPWARRRLNLPYHQRDSERWRAAGVDEAEVGTRRDG